MVSAGFARSGSRPLGSDAMTDMSDPLIGVVRLWIGRPASGSPGDQTSEVKLDAGVGSDRRYQVSPYGLTSTLNDHAERGWFTTCHASSAIAAGAMKKSSGFVLKLSRAHRTSITASMTM
jgi:hypothetical protein